MPEVRDQNNSIMYDVALSFAGEQRGYVEQVYKILHDEHKINVFYDNDEEIQADLWGANLVEKFEEIYGKSSRFCIIFISKEYKQKMWTNVERRSALSKAIKEKKEYILPARFDDTEIPGLLDTISYIDLSNKSPEVFSKIILRKLGVSVTENSIENTTKNIPNVKVSAIETSIVSGIPGIPETITKSHYILIKVENHDVKPVFLKYPQIKLKNSGDSIHIINDDFSNRKAEIGKLEPGDSFEIYVNPNKFKEYIDQLDFIVIMDKIGRAFIVPKEELDTSIRNWKKLIGQ